MNPNDTQVGGTHYAADYQHWDFVLDCKLGYLQAQVTKYLTRWRKKNGLQDLQKARHYATKLLSVLGYDGIHRAEVSLARIENYLRRFALSNPHLKERELKVFSLLAHSHMNLEVGLAVDQIDALIRSCPEEGDATSAYVNQ